jgi:hypothetical protein
LSLALRWLPERFGVYRLAPDQAIPAWATAGAFSTVSRSDTELSVLCAWHEGAPELPVIGPLACAVVEGPLDFALTGILSSLTVPLADAGISVFSVATYDIDYLLVSAAQAVRVQAALAAAGHRFAARD